MLQSSGVWGLTDEFSAELSGSKAWRNAVRQTLFAAVRQIFDMSTNGDTFQIEEAKAIFYEVVEQFQTCIPDVLVIAAGDSVLVITWWKVFNELLKKDILTISGFPVAWIVPREGSGIKRGSAGGSGSGNSRITPGLRAGKYGHLLDYGGVQDCEIKKPGIGKRIGSENFSSIRFGVKRGGVLLALSGTYRSGLLC